MSKSTHAAKSGALVPEAAALLRTIDGQLYQLGWSRQHPRVKRFIERVQQRHTSLNLLGLEEVPFLYLHKLSEFLKIYLQCDQLLKKLHITWEAALIQEIIAEYGGCDKMPILGWKHLYECLENQYFLMDMPNPEAKKKSRKKAEGSNSKR